jgi:acylglycerol lipase
MTQELMEDDLVGTGGLRIFVRSWRPEGKVRGVVAIVHGFNSHSGYYLWAAEQLVASGLAVYALDLRGRGLSDGKRFFIEKFSEYLDDVENLVTFARAREPGLPIFLLGHSAGGVIATVYALEHQAELAGLICESFAFRLPAPAFALQLVRGLSHIAPNAPVLRLKNKDFSRDRTVVQAMDNDPLIAKETEPAKTVAEMGRADKRLEKEFPLIRLPLLILHGTADKATKPSGSMRFHASAGSSDKTLKLYQGHVHDLLNDVDRDVVMADIRMWLDARLPVSRIRLMTPRTGLGILR